MEDSRDTGREISPADRGTEPHQTRYRWVMLALVWLLYCSFGITSRSISPLITPILADLDISYSQMGIILGAWPLTYMVVALIGGAAIDRWGMRKSLFTGIIIIGLSAGLRYLTNGFWSMFFCVALFGMGGPLISIGAPKTISEWFSGKDRGTAVGVYMTGPWIGGLITFSLTNSIVMPLTGYSWRLTFVVYGLLSFAVALVWWLLARDIRPSEAGGKTSIFEVFRALARLRNVQLVLIMGFLAFSVGHGFSNWLPNILETGGLPPAIAGFAASLPLLVSIPVVLFFPRIVPPHMRGRGVALATILTAIALPVIGTTTGAPLIAGLVLLGISSCVGMPLLILILMDMPEVGSKYMGSAGGMFFCIAEIGGFVGPLAVGALVDLTDGFLVSMLLLSGLSVVTSVIALSLKIKTATAEN